jgi:hypothetical protein
MKPAISASGPFEASRDVNSAVGIGAKAVPLVRDPERDAGGLLKG